MIGLIGIVLLFALILTLGVAQSFSPKPSIKVINAPLGITEPLSFKIRRFGEGMSR